MEGGALFNSGYLGSQWQWWIGQIADDATWRDNTLSGKFQDKDTSSGWGRRYKVRIMGYHPYETSELADKESSKNCAKATPLSFVPASANSSKKLGAAEGLIIPSIVPILFCI